jgi:hypothetical protein
VHIEWNRDREASDAGPGSEAMPQAVGGLLHVVNDDGRFQRHFARNVLGGVLQLDRLQLRSATETPERLQQKTAKFKSLWATFDWTQIKD